MSEPYKPCKYRGCETAPRCDHQWWISATQNNDRERGPVANYVQLWPAARADRSVPKTKDQAADLQRYLATWLADGRPAIVKPAPAAAAPGDRISVPVTGAAGLTFGDVLPKYRTDHIDHMKCKAAPGIVNRMQRELAKQPLSLLFDKDAAIAFTGKKDGQALKPSNRSQHIARWSHLMYWCMEEFGIAGASPFFNKTKNRKGIKKMKTVTRTHRPVTVDVEGALIQAARELKDHMMEGRLYCALDAGLRRGEMLQVRPKDIIQNYQGSGMAIHARWEVNKIGHERWVPVTTKRLRTFIQARLQKEFIFGQLDGTRVDEFRDDWIALLKQAGLEDGERVKNPQGWMQYVRTKDSDIHWHDLRHECGSRLAEGRPASKGQAAVPGVPLHELMVLMGHLHLTTTQKYLNATVRSLTAHMKAVHADL